MKQANLVTTAEFAELCRTTPRTIRFYDKKGLLKPVKVDEWTHYRYYSPYQTRDFFRIRLLQNFQVALKDISATISKPYLEEKIAQVQQELSEKRKEYNFLRSINRFFFGKIDLEKVLKKESFGPYTLFGTYVPQGSYHKITTDIYRVEDKAHALGIKTTGRRIVFYLDPDKYKPRDTRLEIAVICKKISKGVTMPQGYFVRKFKKTVGLSFTYEGPSEFITLVYERLHQQNVLGKFSVQRFPFDYEIYGPRERKSPYDQITKIVFPILDTRY